MNFARKVYEWAASKAISSFASLWLGLIFLLELAFFIPFDALLMLFCMHNPQRRFLYASVATFASLLTGLAGYAIGYLMNLWSETIKRFVDRHFNRLVFAFGTKVALTFSFFWVLGQ